MHRSEAPRIPSFVASYIFEFADIKMHRGQFITKLDLHKYDAVNTLVAMQSRSIVRNCVCEEFSLVAAVRKMINVRILSYVVVYSNQEENLVVVKYGIGGKGSRQYTIN
jgi:hypothetical protein